MATTRIEPNGFLHADGIWGPYAEWYCHAGDLPLVWRELHEESCTSDECEWFRQYRFDAVPTFAIEHTVMCMTDPFSVYERRRPSFNVNP